jgi:putative phage-type endonuclease
MGQDARCNFVDCEQGTQEWLEARLGKVTASRFKDVMTNGRGSAASKTADSYMMELIAERLTQTPVNSFSTPATKWGNDNEDSARALYSWRTGKPVDQVGFATKKDNWDVGASSDGLVEEDGTVEIKCPYNPVNHLNTMQYNCVPKQYQWQIQGQLWVLQRKWCDFISFDPRMPESHRMVVIRVERDEELIDSLESRVLVFVENMHRKARELEMSAMEMAGYYMGHSELEAVAKEIESDSGI